MWKGAVVNYFLGTLPRSHQCSKQVTTIKVVSDKHIGSAYVLRKVESVYQLVVTMIRGPPAATQTWWYTVSLRKSPAVLLLPIELQSLNINTINIPLMWFTIEMSDCCNSQHFNEWRNIIFEPDYLWNSSLFLCSWILNLLQWVASLHLGTVNLVCLCHFSLCSVYMAYLLL